ncbi:hypothetical protein G3N95_32340 [Paraburkholderia sp. Tr-20389]|uniref:hypothetical protein n=1 Tax=Paraburkholderia sp. Tr-20389 TaxID=2703903 RepID=UPI00197D1B09|nr:hypothetical protein [Paraburkholderia sp. Tr-20389]MBN3757652.1 hypothetical protein [Paraburkholderia sp. Tr-20389]
MEFKIGAMCVAIAFAATFVVIKRFATDDKYRGLRIVAYGLPVAALGLTVAALGYIDLGMILVAVTFPCYVIGAIKHVKAMLGRSSR